MIRNAIGKCSILRDADSAAKTKMIAYGLLRKYEKKDTLFLEREQMERIYVVAKGYLALYKMNKRAERKIIFILQPGEILGAEILEKPVTSVGCIALSDVELISFSRKQFAEIMEASPDFSREVLAYMAGRIRRLYRQISNTSNAMKLEWQVASKLWKLGKDYGIDQGKYIELPFELTITFLADMVGSKRETVSRVIKSMSKRGIVRIERGRCHIYDTEQLRRITCEE